MDILLPKKIDSEQDITLKGVKQITVIGANGAGKTRFTNQLLVNCKDKAFKMSALKASFPSLEKNTRTGSIDMLYDVAQSSGLIHAEARTEMERLLYLLMHDECVELLRFKLSHSDDTSKVKLPVTKLDRVIKCWERIFQGNKILRTGTQILFGSNHSEETYGIFRLSDGEKAALYYLGAVLYAMPEAVIMVDDPTIYIHHSIMQTLWDTIEQLRPDCTFIYNTHDVDFAASRISNRCIWVKTFDALKLAWDYEVLESNDQLSDQLYVDLLGSRKPVLFIEGDNIHSIDAKLYPLVFKEFTVKPLGSCNKVIESTRSFNDLNAFHHLDSYGIVDRDRREDKEVEYLRNKKIFVPEVAEIENLLLLPDVIKAVAQSRGRNPEMVYEKVSRSILNLFRDQMKAQALMHVRHRVKRTVEFRIDRRFSNINQIENHMLDLVQEINPRGMYDSILKDFTTMYKEGNYMGVLKVFNQKSMLPECNVATLCGLFNKDNYINRVLALLKEDKDLGQQIRSAIRSAFLLK